MAKLDTSKQNLISKIDELFGFNLSNKADGVAYDFGQYKLNKLYKPLVKYFIEQFMQHLENYTEQEAEKILGLFTDFYSLYYSNGDFGYFKNKFSTYQYRIPYSGKDTEFRWATKDCYYVKTSDVVNDMAVSVGGLFEGKELSLKLFKETHTETNDAGEDRYNFDVKVEEIVDDDSEEMVGYKVVFVNYEEDKGTKQPQKVSKIKEMLESKGVQYTNPVIKKTIDEFLKKRGRDYFIHKRLKSFLAEEVERYFFQMLKNDIQAKSDIIGIQKKIEEVKAKYSDDPAVIEFKIGQLMKESSKDLKLSVYETAYLRILNYANILGDLEEFKARLWNKKRKIVKQEYCITIGKIIEYETLMPRKNDILKEILSNKDQLKEREDLLAEGNKYLEKITLVGIQAELQNGIINMTTNMVVDTKRFDKSSKLYQTLHERGQKKLNEDGAKLDGLIIKSENYQAGMFLLDQYSNCIESIYNDPPYNTEKDKSDGSFPYKDGYDDSTRLTMMFDRYIMFQKLLTTDGIIQTSIGNDENDKLLLLQKDIFGDECFISNNIWLKGKEGGNDNDGMGLHHEYIQMFGRSKGSAQRINLDQKDVSRHITKLQEPNLVKGIKSVYKDGEAFQLINLSKQKDYIVKIPLVDGSIIEWPSYCPQKTIDEYISIGKMFVGKKLVPYVKSFLSDEKDGTKPSSIIEQQFGTTKAGGIEIRELFGSKPFNYPKPSKLMKRIFSYSCNNGAIISDFFLGSGTSIQGYLQLKEEKKNLKFVGCELGAYFDSIIIPRLKKILFSKDWKDGTPLSVSGYGGYFSYIYLNQYEDWFNDDGYLSKVDGDINHLSNTDLSTIGDIKQILYPLSQLKDRIYGLDDEVVQG